MSSQIWWVTHYCRLCWNIHSLILKGLFTKRFGGFVATDGCKIFEEDSMLSFCTSIIYPPPADHIPINHQLTTYRPPTDHLPTTYPPPMDHLQTTYGLPTTYFCSSRDRIKVKRKQPVECSMDGSMYFSLGTSSINLHFFNVNFVFQWYSEVSNWGEHESTQPNILREKPNVVECQLLWVQHVTRIWCAGSHGRTLYIVNCVVWFSSVQSNITYCSDTTVDSLHCFCTWYNHALGHIFGGPILE